MSGYQQETEFIPDHLSKAYSEGARHWAVGKLRNQQRLSLQHWEAITSPGAKGQQEKQGPWNK